MKKLIFTCLGLGIGLASLVYAVYIHRKQSINASFEKRSKVYDAIRTHITSILRDHQPDQDAAQQFLIATKHVPFLFGKDIKKFCRQIYTKTCDLLRLCKMEKSLTREKRNINLDRQDEIIDWFVEELRNIDTRFKKYLQL